MKNLVKCLFLAIALLFGLSCSKNESVEVNTDPCAKGKFLYPWCSPFPGLTVIQVLDTAIGGDVLVPPGKTIKNAVLAHLDVTLRNKGMDLNGIVPSDSILYFTYEKKYPDFGVCDLGNRPKINIRLTSILSAPCPIPPNK